MEADQALKTVVDNERTAFLKDVETVCGGPGCTNRFGASGPQVRPRQYCSHRCRQRASVIKRAARILDGFTPEALLEILAKAGSD
jgi:hypothetical protein